jgi:PIN domain nuclease of toxin-antitoxin system
MPWERTRLRQITNSIWLLIPARQSKISSAAGAFHPVPENAIYFSAASIWETAIKASFGKINSRYSPETIVQAAQKDRFY